MLHCIILWIGKFEKLIKYNLVPLLSTHTSVCPPDWFPINSVTSTLSFNVIQSRFQFELHGVLQSSQLS